MPEVTVRGAPIAWHVVDDAAPWRAERDTIVFHHGLGSCAAAWSGWTSALVADYRLVRFDMRGHGRSPLPPDHRWSIEAMLADLAAVADAAGAERFHLVGESIGGTVGLAFAIAHPARVRSLTVSNGAYLGGTIRNVERWAQIIDEGGMAAWSAHMMGMRFREGALSAPMHRWYETMQASCDPRGLLDALAVLTGADLGPRLAEVRCPVLLLHPDSSPFIPVELMAELKARLADARLEVFPDARHGLPFSHAPECARALAAFLGALSARPAAAA